MAGRTLVRFPDLLLSELTAPPRNASKLWTPVSLTSGSVAPAGQSSAPRATQGPAAGEAEKQNVQSWQLHSSHFHPMDR